jgi:Tol biopolymer transport system component
MYINYLRLRKFPLDLLQSCSFSALFIYSLMLAPAGAQIIFEDVLDDACPTSQSPAGGQCTELGSQGGLSLNAGMSFNDGASLFTLLSGRETGGVNLSAGLANFTQNYGGQVFTGASASQNFLAGGIVYNQISAFGFSGTPDLPGRFPIRARAFYNVSENRARADFLISVSSVNFVKLLPDGFLDREVKVDQSGAPTPDNPPLLLDPIFADTVASPINYGLRLSCPTGAFLNTPPGGTKRCIQRTSNGFNELAVLGNGFSASLFKADEGFVNGQAVRNSNRLLLGTGNQFELAGQSQTLEFVSFYNPEDTDPDDGKTPAVSGTLETFKFTYHLVNEFTNRVPNVGTTLLTAPAATVGSAFNFQLQFTDPDNDPLTYGAINLPQGLSLNSATGLISGTPQVAGAFEPVITVSDGKARGNNAAQLLLTVNAMAPSGGGGGGGGGSPPMIPAAPFVKSTQLPAPLNGTVSSAGASQVVLSQVFANVFTNPDGLTITLTGGNGGANLPTGVSFDRTSGTLSLSASASASLLDINPNTEVALDRLQNGVSPPQRGPASLTVDVIASDGTNQVRFPVTIMLNNNRDSVKTVDLIDTQNTTTIVPQTVLAANSTPRSTARASIDMGGDRIWPSVSHTGSDIMLETMSLAANMVSGQHVQRYDVDSGRIEALSRINQAGVLAPGLASGIAEQSVVSPDGRFYAFASTSSQHLANGQGNGQGQIFVGGNITPIVDGVTPAPQLASSDANGTLGNGASQHPDLSRDGRYVAFESLATNLIAGQNLTPGVSRLYRKDRQSGEIKLLTPLQTQARYPSISGDGSRVGFMAEVSPGNWQAQIVTVESGAISGFGPALPSNGLPRSLRARLSQDGRWFAYMIPGVGALQVIVFDVIDNRFVIANSTANAALANGASDSVALSADGRYVVFRSDASNLISGVSGSQIYLKDIYDGRLAVVSATASGSAGDGPSRAPAIAGNGKTVSYVSLAANLTGKTAVERIMLAANPLLSPFIPGAYVDLNDSGRGYGIDLLGDRIFFQTFQYREDGRAVWYVGFGNLSAGSNTASFPVMEFQVQNGMPTPITTVGTAELTFTSQTKANFKLANISTVIELLPLDNRAVVAANRLEAPESGFWFDPAQPGLGYQVTTQRNGGQDAIFVIIDRYENGAQGDASWMITTLNENPTTPGLYEGSALAFTGGQSFNNPGRRPTQQVLGTASWQQTSPLTATLTLPGGVVVPLVRFAF